MPQHHALVAERLGTLADEVGIGHGTGINADLFRPGQQHGVHRFQRVQTAANAERNEDFAGHPANHVEHDAAPLGGGGDVVKHQLVGTFLVITAGHVHGITNIHVALELDPLGRLAGADI